MLRPVALIPPHAAVAPGTDPGARPHACPGLRVLALLPADHLWRDPETGRYDVLGLVRAVEPGSDGLAPTIEVLVRLAPPWADGSTAGQRLFIAAALVRQGGAHPIQTTPVARVAPDPAQHDPGPIELAFVLPGGWRLDQGPYELHVLSDWRSVHAEALATSPGQGGAR